MNAAQRRKVYRAMTKLMRDKTPVRVRAPWPKQGRVTTTVGAVYKDRGVIQTVEEFNPFGHRYYPTGRVIPARYVKPIPRCYRTTL